MKKEAKKTFAPYDHSKIEAKWQKAWAAKKAFVSKNDSKDPKKYILIEFPYPSGAGLHMGHMRPYIAGDVVSRYFRLKGFNAMYPIGWDAFGLPAENYAIKNKVHPRVSTAANVANAKKQLLSWGVGFDWSREVNTTDPAYYKWTQWLFLQFFKAGLAYEKEGPINWCPQDKTGLANEEVIDGKCERCGAVVEKKTLRQWYLKITEYADSLVDGLANLSEWPEHIRKQQENWIGRSEGAEIEFQIKGSDKKIKVFTTRPDTLFGVTYVVLAPESKYVDELKSKIKNWPDVEKYIESQKGRTDIERTAEGKEKSGIALEGISVINPVNKEEVPVWLADYVLANYGTGAVMAVPAHDERDFAFAGKYGLKMIDVIEPNEKLIDEYYIRKSIDKRCYTGQGLLKNSGKFNGRKNTEVTRDITAFAGGRMTKKYRLQDWLFSRQRYWGEPIPLIHCEKCGVVAVPEKDLPVKLPDVKNYEPTGTGESPLAAIEKWVNTKCPQCGGKAKRETNTMPQWAGSSWYWLRYADPKNTKAFAAKDALKYWTPVDLYFGGLEHTTLHLLYARFWNQFLFDQKLVPTKEPFTKRVPHGIVLGPDGEKMSKSRGNVVNPDDIVKTYGADTMRLHMQFLGPHEAQVAWNDQGIIGTRRFIERVWNAQKFIADAESTEVTQLLHKTIKKVSDDVEQASFNTAISAMMIFIKNIDEAHPVTLASFKAFITLLSPFAPHACEEIWKNLGGKTLLVSGAWPVYDESKLAASNVSIAVQVNGKVRATLDVAFDSPQEAVEAIALKNEHIVKWTLGKQILKKIFVKNKILNFVV